MQNQSECEKRRQHRFARRTTHTDLLKKASITCSDHPRHLAPGKAADARPEVGQSGIRARITMASRRTVLSLEGNIGAGKSTLMRLLRDRGGLCTIDEPVARWQSVSAPDARESDPPVNMLELFYNEPKRWAFTFQTFAFLSRAQSAVESLEGRAGAVDGQSSAAIVLERSLDSDKHIFATNCLTTGLFTRGEWAVYANYHKWTAEQHPQMKVDGFVYMRTNPSTCQQRCAKRSRSEDAAIGLDYLSQIHARHEEWLLDGWRGTAVSEPVDLTRTRTSAGVPVLVLDCDREFEDDRARNAEVAQAVCGFAEEVAMPCSARTTPGASEAR